MDILAHSLWTAASAKALNNHKKTKKPLSIKIAAFWGVFPDLFAFTVPFLYIIWQYTSGAWNGSDFPQLPQSSHFEPGAHEMLPVFQTATRLYNVSHSAVVFAIVFFIFWYIRKKPYWELFGWLLHIFIDIPTHTYQFYPTPVFWPLFGWKFDGVPWSLPWFMVLNYSLLFITIIVLWVPRKKLFIWRRRR